MSPIENHAEKTLILKHLQAHGYAPELNGSRHTIASKRFASVVGEKEARVYLTGFDAQSVTLFLTADMLSEGRNCLVGCAAYPTKPLTEAGAARCVAQFCASVEKTVADLVVVRLLRQQKAGDDPSESEAPSMAP